jgi:hypothetical protein
MLIMLWPALRKMSSFLPLPSPDVRTAHAIDHLLVRIALSLCLTERLYTP